MKRGMIFLLVILIIFLVQASVFEDKIQSDFNSGVFYRTFYNSSHGYLQLNLSQGFLYGNFTSRVFNAGGVSIWNNVSWIQGAKYGVELPNNNSVESVFRGANMTGNVLLFHFNETSGIIYDHSGFGNNGTVVGGITYNFSGRFGVGIKGLGSTGRIVVTNNPSLNVTNTITIEAWINWTGESGENFNLQNVVTAGNWEKALRVTEPDHWNGGSQVFGQFKIGGVSYELYSTEKVPVGRWAHVAVTYNGSALSLYIDGRLGASTPASGQIVFNDDDIYIAAESGSVSNFDGSIDEVAIYNRSLSNDEILSRYERGVASLNLSVRSCDDSSCSGEGFSQLNSSSPQQLNLSNNTYFQYFLSFNSENESVGPTFYNISVDYSLSNLPPSLSLALPANGSIFNYNTSIPLNFSVSDADGNLQSCWYSINGGSNVSIASCLNTTFNASAGIKNLTLYANDSVGALSSNITFFTIDNLAPLVRVTYPQNVSYNFVQSSLNYTSSDANLQSCWYSLNGGQSNTTLTCGDNLTSLSSSQSQNTWIVYANDSAGNLNFSSVSFFVDSISPLISFSSSTSSSNSLVARNWVFVNVSTIESNEVNITFNLYNSASLVNSTTSTSGLRELNWTNLQDGVYYYNVTIFDILSNTNSTETRTITLDTAPPFLTVLSPSQTNYSNSTTLVNISSDGDTIWFFNGTGNETYTAPVYRNFSQGGNTLTAYASDVAGNLNFSSISFNVDSLSPSLTLIRPLDGSTFGTNISLALNYSVSDANLQSCWYNIDGGQNFTISNCLNTTFNISVGTHTIYLLANDSFGNSIQKSAGFNVQIGAPSISLVDPVDSYFDTTQNIDFTYTASDLDLEVCELWGNFSGGWGLNQSNFSVVSGIESHFFLNLSEGSYSWNIRCNDSVGNSAFASNESFYIDTAYPTLTLSAPSGTYSSRINVPLTYSVSDASPISCYYNVYRGAVLEISNTSINCYTGSSSFSLTLDNADFILNFYAEDPVGHITHKNSSFSVSTAAPPSGGGGGGGSGGGSGGGAIVTKKPSLDVGAISSIVVSEGGIKKTNSWKVKNTGSSFLNSCRFKSQGEYASWITKTETKGLSAGEEYTFVFDVNIPENVADGVYGLDVFLDCQEINKTTSFNVDIKGKTLDFKLINVERVDDKNVSVKYTIKELFGEEQNIELQFLIFDLDNKKEAEIKEIKVISGNSEEEYTTLIPIREDLEGELSLLVNLNSETYSSFVQENIVLGKGVSGFSVFGGLGGKNTWLSVFLVVLFLVFAFFIVRRIRFHHKVIKVRHFWKKNHPSVLVA